MSTQPVTRISAPPSPIPILNILRAFLVEETDDIQSEEIQIFTSVPVLPVPYSRLEMEYSKFHVVKQLKFDGGYDQHWGVAIGQARDSSGPLPIRDLVAINLDDPTREVNWKKEFAEKLPRRPFHTNALLVEGVDGVLSVPESSVYAGIWEDSKLLTDEAYAILPGKEGISGKRIATDTASLMTLGRHFPAFLRARPHDFEYWFDPAMQKLNDEERPPSIDAVIAAVSDSYNQMPTPLRKHLQLPPSFYSAPERS